MIASIAVVSCGPKRHLQISIVGYVRDYIQMSSISSLDYRTLWWWRNSFYERKELWSLPDVTRDISRGLRIAWIFLALSARKSAEKTQEILLR